MGAVHKCDGLIVLEVVFNFAKQYFYLLQEKLFVGIDICCQTDVVVGVLDWDGFCFCGLTEMYHLGLVNVVE